MGGRFVHLKCTNIKTTKSQASGGLPWRFYFDSPGAGPLAAGPAAAQPASRRGLATDHLLRDPGGRGSQAEPSAGLNLRPQDARLSRFSAASCPAAPGPGGAPPPPPHPQQPRQPAAPHHRRHRRHPGPRRRRHSHRVSAVTASTAASAPAAANGCCRTARLRAPIGWRRGRAGQRCALPLARAARTGRGEAAAGRAGAAPARSPLRSHVGLRGPRGEQAPPGPSTALVSALAARVLPLSHLAGPARAPGSPGRGPIPPGRPTMGSRS